MIIFAEDLVDILELEFLLRDLLVVRDAVNVLLVAKILHVDQGNS
jgi:hypothetical protein